MEPDEGKSANPIWAWVVILGLIAATIGWGLLNYALIPDAQREWDHGQLQDTPGESIYSTQPAPKTTQESPRQLEVPADPHPAETQPADPARREVRP